MVFYKQNITRVDLPFSISVIVWKVNFRYSRLAFHEHGLSLLPRFAQSGCFGSRYSRRKLCSVAKGVADSYTLAASAPINWLVIFMNLSLKDTLSTK